MNITIASSFRNASLLHVQRWVSQIVALRKHLREHYYCSIRSLAVEGDSDTDATTRYLLSEALKNPEIGLDLRSFNHGYPHFGSIEHPDRMRSLSMVGNYIFDSILPTDDVVVYVESDLIWDAMTIRQLVDFLYPQVGRADPPFSVHKYTVLAPMIFAGQLFYDVWGFRGLDGARFSPLPPYHSSFNGHRSPLHEVGSAGSCLVMTGDAARSARITKDDCLVGWCANARSAGHRIAVSMDHSVFHPT